MTEFEIDINGYDVKYIYTSIYCVNRWDHEWRAYGAMPFDYWTVADHIKYCLNTVYKDGYAGITPKEFAEMILSQEVTND